MLVIKPIPALKDNYIWALINIESKGVIIIDPGAARPVIQFLEKEQLHLEAIFITHHHWDHSNGIAELVKKYDVPVYGSEKENIRLVTHPLKDKQEIKLNAFLTFTTLLIPGHTLGHMAYYTPGQVFTGDTLFAAGCGRLFEGTAKQMWHSLEKLASLPPETLMYCGHEYTLANLAFAKSVEPENMAIIKRIEKVKALRQENLPSLPSTLAEELQTNPFLRCSEDSVKHGVEKYAGKKLTSTVEVFSALRQWKDGF